MGRQRYKHLFEIITLFGTLAVVFDETSSAYVRKIEPNTGGLGGEVKITIDGGGFSADQFSLYDDPNKGNIVYFVSQSDSMVNCKVLREYTTENRIVCYTPEDMSEETYYVKVVTDGVAIGDSDLCSRHSRNYNCRYHPSSRLTPSITSLTPQSGLPGGIVKISGKLFTNRYGSDPESTTFYRRSQELVRVYVGPRDCDLKNGDDLFGLKLNYDTSDYGWLQCRTQGHTVGYFNASFIVESPYGRSIPSDSIYRVSSNDKIYMYQIYAEITSISPMSGSTEGGLTLTVYGNYFDDRPPYVPPKVFIADTECKITRVVVDEYIECIVAEDPGYKASDFQGNRGVALEYWNSTSKSMSNIDDILALNSSDQGYTRQLLDDTYHYNTDPNIGNYVSRMTTLFVPPHSGVYMFLLKANYGGKLFVDGDEVVRSASSSSFKYSSRMNLNASNKYLLKVLHYGYGENSYVEVGAKFFNTTYTKTWTGKAEQEVQTMNFNADIVRDVQVLTFSGFSNSSYVKEIQTLDITTAGFFRLGLFGVYTEPLSNLVDETIVNQAINALPVFASDEFVTVIRNPNTSADVSFTLTFESKRGDFPKVDIIAVADNPAPFVNVTENIKGSPDMDTVAIGFDGAVSLPFSLTELDPKSLETTLDQLFSAQCPDFFSGSPQTGIYENFEHRSNSFSGVITKETEPFCGRYSLQNPGKMFTSKQGIPLIRYSKLCFAYKGLIENYVELYYSYKLFYDESYLQTYWKARKYSFEFKRDSNAKSTTWYYTCFDMMSHVSGEHPDGYDIQLEGVSIARSVWTKNIYVDALYIGRKATVSDFDEINLRRRPAAMPNGVIINRATVTSFTGNMSTVTFEPYDCGNKFPLLELVHSQVLDGNVSYPSNAVTFILSNGASGTLSVERTSQASPKLTGYVDVSFRGNEKYGLDVSLTDSVFGKELESLLGIGDLFAQKNGDCANFAMRIVFSSLPGDLPEMVVSSDGLTGINANASITTNTDGGLFYTPLTGDMLFTVHNKAQVRVLINDVPTKCSGNCSFEWDASVTPRVISVLPTKGAMTLKTTIEIAGSGFESEPSKNTVVIGGVICAVTAASSTSITCNIGDGPVGTHTVVVTVAGKGHADHTAGEVTFTYNSNVTSIDPEAGSQGGGLILTVRGYGFANTALVMVGSRFCDIIDLTTANITCMAPVSVSAGMVDVTVIQNSENITFSGFNYSSALTPKVSSIIPSTISLGGATVTAFGSNFGDSGNVSVGSVIGCVISYTDTEIVFQVAGVSAGVQEVKLGGVHGYALSGDRRPTINVETRITNVYPLSGSLQGGTKLTITGVGLGDNSSVVTVDVGAVKCDIETINNTEIICKVAESGKIHSVTNRGTHRAYGVYYAFDVPQLTVQRGDFVDWNWETPFFVNDINHAIIQVENRSSTVAMDGGFSSGKPSREGSFQYQFTQLGMFFVWSGYVDRYGIKNYAGQIEVVEKTSELVEISVQMDGIEPLYNVGGSADPNDSSVCQSVLSAKSGCSDALPSSDDSSKFTFAFWTCATPVVNMVVPHNGTANTPITISGEGFSTKNCQNEIFFSDNVCRVLSSSESSVVCFLDRLSQPELGVSHPISMRVRNRGNAIVKIMSPQNRSFSVLPNVEDITPTEGSLAGGAILTIKGFGFGNFLLVTVGSFSCRVLKSSYTTVQCETPASAYAQDVDVKVYVMISGAAQIAACETRNRRCEYSYSLTLTPNISSVEPKSMSGATTFTITGMNFGVNTSALKVMIGSESATLISLNDSCLIVFIQNIAAGSNIVVMNHSEYGKASGSFEVRGILVLSSITPSLGSIHGETEITIRGNGFVDGKTLVTINDEKCLITFVSLSEVTCITPAQEQGLAAVGITSNSVSYISGLFFYGTNSTPTVASISPSFGLPGEILKISGSNLAGTNVRVLLDGVPCNIISSSSSQIHCTTGAHSTGFAPVYVYVKDLGGSNTDVEFQYTLELLSIYPKTGSIAGGQTVTLSGQGFSDAMTATICDIRCIELWTNSTVYECKTMASTAQTCDVEVAINGLSWALSKAYTYDAALTPIITGVWPKRGGTGGGTVLTVTGSGFGNDMGDILIKIDNVICIVTKVNDTGLECETGPHHGSFDAVVEVELSGNGIAKEKSVGDSAFSYIDVWSSIFTWGGTTLPAEGEFVVIPAGQTLLLDISTPILSFLLIQGGQLIFDERDIELQANNIMITDGGLLQVGTESKPFRHNAIIRLHGYERSRELPIYGTKTLAVRNGSLELHGQEVPLTWTRLAATAAVGDMTIDLVEPVQWNVGDKIVIAATGKHGIKNDNEKKTIAAKSPDNMTLTLDSALEAVHVGTEETFNGIRVEFRAEVGLLTHNVVVQGSRDPDLKSKVETCPEGFNPGEFRVQTCSQSRFGDKMGNSKFGGIILVHSPEKDTHFAEARISYTEVEFAGQAYRLGRYPIHFYLNGDMSTSYIRGISIHTTFNRAINLQGSHNTSIEKTVIYNIMGSGIVFEDGSETGNTLQYNLVISVRGSTSLQSYDITPASFFITNPNNIIQHNAAAGGSNYGYWYRLNDHPEGPSSDSGICPVTERLGVFQNNSAHSFCSVGLLVFREYYPLQDGCFGGVEPAVFGSLAFWNNKKGVVFADVGALQVNDSVLVNNRIANYEVRKVVNVPLYTDDSPMIKNCLIIGETDLTPSATKKCSNSGIVLPHGTGFRVKNVQFVNFVNTSCVALSVINGCLFCGGYTYHIDGVSFTNAPNIARFAWEWEAILIDKNGTLTGKLDKEWKVLPTSGTLPNDCERAPAFSFGVEASMCPPQYKFHRFYFSSYIKAFKGKNFLISNRYGISTVPYSGKGWLCALVDGETYMFQFEYAEHIYNISLYGTIDDFQANDYLFIRFPLRAFPDRVSVNGGATFINPTLEGLDPAVHGYGDWEWDNDKKEVKLLVRGSRRATRGSSSSSERINIQFISYRCYFRNCTPPPNPNTIPPAKQRQPVHGFWSNPALWYKSGDGYIENSEGSYGVPQNFDDVRILYHTWVVINDTINKLGILILEGSLELDDNPKLHYEIFVEYIIIIGGRLIIGWPDAPFHGSASLILRENPKRPYDSLRGAPLGDKAIGVFGGLELNGRDVGVSWTKLRVQASTGDNRITLDKNVSWVVGDEIVIGPSRFNPWETETFRITAVSEDGVTLTLNGSLKYDHLVYNETFPDGQFVDLAAPVGLLTRNIKIIGEKSKDLRRKWHGARVLVGLSVMGSQAYIGYARLSNVEFVHTGQEGFTEPYDARFSIAYIATGNVSNIKPSYVKKCSFHQGFNSAIGAFGIRGLNITDNVVLHTVGNAIITNSDDTLIKNNMVTLMEWTGTYQDRYEPLNFRWEAAIEAMEAKRLVLLDNLVTGSERFGYHVPPLQCSDSSNRYRNNRAFSNLIGYGILPEDSFSGDCVKISGFVLWKNHDYGIYYQNKVDVKIENNVLADNRQGIWIGIAGPNPVNHSIDGKIVEISSVLLVGASPFFDCKSDVSPVNDNMKLSNSARPPMAPSGGMIGVVFPNFMGGFNGAPKGLFTGMLTYSAIAGLMKLKNVTFAHYGRSSCGGAFAIGTNKNNDDGQHPIETEQIKLYNVDPAFKIIYHRPNIAKINPNDCGDMDCDALKKALLKDLDGTFLGNLGCVIPQSEFEWGAKGLDRRTPKEMVTGSNGTRIPYHVIAPNKGIIRNRKCKYRPSWQAYECGPELNFEMLIIESMDSDTETRRISPVALIGNGYIDLINGPPCHGRKRKRISTFKALVATENEYLLHFTGTTPFHMRYTLLNTDKEAIKLTVWYSRPNRLDVYVNGTYIMAKNARINHLGFYVLDIPKADEYTPSLTDATGTNKVDHERGEHTIIIKGPTPVNVITSEVLIVSFGLPAMTVEYFYGANIVEHLAHFLSIPLTKVRVVNVVSENSKFRRNKRDSNGISAAVEVGDEPSSGTNGTESDTLSTAVLLYLASEIVNECQVGNLSASLNVAGSCTTVEVPAASASEDLIVYTPQRPDHLVFTIGVRPSYENVLLHIQPKIQAVDEQSVIVSDLGTIEYPWQLTASIRQGTGHPDAVLSGNLRVNASKGWFNFTDLTISHMGTGYNLDFNVTYPAKAEKFTLSTKAFNITKRPLKAHVINKTSGALLRNAAFSISIDLRDSQTEAIISDIGWRNHTWFAEVALLADSKYGNLAGDLSANFDLMTGQATFPNLSITGFGIFYIQFCVYSDPPEYNLTLNERMVITNPRHVGLVPEEQYDIKVKFGAKYDELLSTETKQNEFEQMILSEYANAWPDVRMKDGAIERDSITVTFVIDGTRADLNTTAYYLCESISNGTNYTFDDNILSLDKYMTVNNKPFYGVLCGVTETDDISDDVMSPFIIAIIVVVILLVITVVAVLVVMKYFKSKASQPHDLRPRGPQYFGHDDLKVEHLLFHKNTFTNTKFYPPTGTHIGSESRLLERSVTGLSASAISVHANTLEPWDLISKNESTAKHVSDAFVLPGSASPAILSYMSPSPTSVSGISTVNTQSEESDSPQPSSLSLDERR